MVLLLLLLLACAATTTSSFSHAAIIYGYGSDVSVGLFQNVIFDFYSTVINANTTVNYHAMSTTGTMCGFAGKFEGACANQFKYQDSIAPHIDFDSASSSSSSNTGGRSLLDVVPHERRIDFAISDAPLEDASVPDLRSFPLFVFGLAPIYNLPGVPRLVLSRAALASIFRGCDVTEDGPQGCLPGSITRWDDPAILASNPEPAVQAALTAAGAIKVVVRADADATVVAFKRALSKFDQAFHQQIGATTSTLETSNLWPGTASSQFVYAVGDRGVQRAVTHAVGAIGFDRIHANIQLGTAQTELLYEDGSGKTLAATTDALETAGREIADDVGGDDEQLQLDLIGVTGKRSWPISLVSYISFRTNVLTEECRYERSSLISLIEHVYNNSGEASRLFHDGLAALPYSGSQKLLNIARKDIRCNGQLVYVYPAALRTIYYEADESFHDMVEVFAKGLEKVFPFNLNLIQAEHHLAIKNRFLCISNTTCSAETNYGLIVLADEDLTAEMVQDDVDTNVYSLVSLPFLAVSTGFIFNLCPPGGSAAAACAYRYASPLVLDVATAARILDQQITTWDDAAIAELNPDKILPAQPIVVIAGSRTSSYHRNFVKKVQDSYLPTFEYTAGGERGTFLEAWMDVSLTPYSFSFVVFNATIVQGVEKVSLVNQRGVAVATSPAAIEACAMDTFNSQVGYFSVHLSQELDCYPLVNTYNVFLKNILPRGFTVQISNAMLKQTHRTAANAYQTPISVSELGTLTDLQLHDGTDMWARSVGILESMIFTTGLSILLVPHELNLIPAAAIYTIYTLLAVELVAFASLAVWVTRNRNRKLVRNSSPTFMLQVLLGAAIMACTVIPLSMQDDFLVPKGVTAAKLEETTAALPGYFWLNVACVADPVLFSFGFFIAFSALFLKSWRLIRIFNNRRLRNLYLKDRELLSYQVMVILFVAVLNAIWIGTDPMVWERVPAFYNADKLVVNSNGLCVSRTGVGPVLPLLIAILIFLALGNYLAYVGRRIPTEFNESKWTAMTMVVAMEALVIGIPVLALTSAVPVGGFIIKSLVCLLIPGSAVGLIFVPKVMLAYGFFNNEGDSNPWQFKNSDNSSKKNGGGGSGSKRDDNVKAKGMVPTSRPASPNNTRQLGGPRATLAPAHGGEPGSTTFGGSPSFHQLASNLIISTSNNSSHVPNYEYSAPPSSKSSSAQYASKSELLSAILRDDPMRRKFRRYLQTLKMEENVRFWDAALVIQAETDPHRRYIGSRAIIQTFVIPNSAFEVNLSSRTRQDLLQAFETNDKDKLAEPGLFKEATKELFDDLRQSDAFRSYMEHDMFSIANMA